MNQRITNTVNERFDLFETSIKEQLDQNTSSTNNLIEEIDKKTKENHHSKIELNHKLDTITGQYRSQNILQQNSTNDMVTYSSVL